MKRSMINTLRLGTVFGISALAVACGGGGSGSSADTTASDPAPVARSLGLMELTVSGLGTRNITSHARMVSGGPVAHVASPTPVPLGLDVEQSAASTNDVGTPGAGGVRYYTVVYNVRNAQFCNTPGTCTPYTTASKNLTLVAANTATNINNTAITAISLFDGSSTNAAKAMATSLVPTHGMVLNHSSLVIGEGLASLQVYTESEMSAVARDPGATDLFPYGYVVNNLNGSRTLPANLPANHWDGEVAFSFKLPLQSDATQDPFSITMIFQVIEDANTRVTESLEEQNPLGDLAATLRAATLGSTDLAVLGGRVAQTNLGDPICTVRTAGTTALPTAHLANNGTVNNGATIASAPYNLRGLATAGGINLGFCTPMQVPTAAKMVVSGSQSGLHSSGSRTGSGDLLGFTPTQPFLAGETVNYTLTTGIKSAGGTALAKPFVGSFVAGGVPAVASSGTFKITSSPAVGVAPFAVAEGDFDGDGALDLAVASPSGTVTILLNNGSGGFTPNGTITVGSTPVYIVAGDFDGDGKPDLAVANSGSSTLSILLNDGHGNFSVSSTPSTGGGSIPRGLAVADFDGDGKPDIAVADDNGQLGQLSVLHNNGAGFTLLTPAIAIATAVKVVAADFNGDGFPDVAVLNQGGGTVVVLLNDGSGNFAAAPGSPLSLPSAATPSDLAIGDFNGDGKLDLAVSDQGNNNIYILISNGNGSFNVAAGSPAVQGGSIPVGVAVGDFNGDGMPDLAVSNQTTKSVSILLNDGTGTFASGVSSNITVSAGPLKLLVAGDFDGDGRQDLAVANGSGTTTITILNGKP
ncbi:MAG: FG-GAP repeat domain-containing protein [Nevskiales bacterium]